MQLVTHVCRLLLVQGILNIRPAQCGMDVRGVLTRLWVHEHLRVFGDRLVCAADVNWLRQLIHELLASKFDSRQEFTELFEHRSIMFGK